MTNNAIKYNRASAWPRGREVLGTHGRKINKKGELVLKIRIADGTIHEVPEAFINGMQPDGVKIRRRKAVFIDGA